MKILQASIVAILVSPLYSLEFAYPNVIEQKDKVFHLIERGLYCTEDEECTSVSLGCPFGCAVFINKKHKEGIVFEARSYHEINTRKCTYKCPSLPAAKCVKNRCTEAVVSKPSESQDDNKSLSPN